MGSDVWDKVPKKTVFLHLPLGSLAKVFSQQTSGPENLGACFARIGETGDMFDFYVLSNVSLFAFFSTGLANGGFEMLLPNHYHIFAFLFERVYLLF